jgi:hypothetical protein
VVIPAFSDVALVASDQVHSTIFGADAEDCILIIHVPGAGIERAGE